jgi:C-terminal processing protease CtpA/Prc
MQKLTVLISLMALLTGIPALAGEKCPGTAEDCLKKMAAELPKTGIVGVDGEWDEGAQAYRVDVFAEGTHAAEAGMLKGDMIVTINGVSLADKKAYWEDRANRAPGKAVEVVVLRDGQKKALTVTLMPLSKQMIAEQVGMHMLEAHAETAAKAGA